MNLGNHKREKLNYVKSCSMHLRTMHKRNVQIVERDRNDSNRFAVVHRLRGPHVCWLDACGISRLPQTQRQNERSLLPVMIHLVASQESCVERVVQLRLDGALPWSARSGVPVNQLQRSTTARFSQVKGAPGHRQRLVDRQPVQIKYDRSAVVVQLHHAEEQL